VAISVGWSAHETGDVSRARFVVSPQQIDFGGVPLHETSALTVVVANPGHERLVIHRIHAPAPFASLDTSIEIGPGQSLPLSIAFSPTEAGDARGTVEFEATGASARVELLGRGTALPTIHVDPLSVSFGNVDVGGVSKALFTIENRGEGPLDLQDLRTTSPFQLAVDRRRIDPGEATVVEVRFSPPSARRWNAQLLIESNDPKTRRMKLSLFGSGVADGVAPAIAVNPTGVDFGTVKVGDSAQRWVEIRNNGGAELMISSVTLAAPFHSNTRSRPIAAQSSIRLPVSYSPREPGARILPMIIHSNDPESGTLVVALMGEGSVGRSDEASGVAGRESRTQTGAAGHTGWGGNGTDGANPGAETGGEGFAQVGDPAEGEGAPEADASDPDATQGSDGPSGPGILEGSKLLLSSYDAVVGDTHVGGFTVDPASGTFQLTDVQLPTIHAPLMESFSFLPTEGTGTMNELGDMDVWLPITVMDKFGNPGTVNLRLTTGTAFAAVGGTVETAVGSPVGPDGNATLVGIGGFSSGPLSKDRMRLTLRVHVGD
jgi:hypothetical protein